MLYTFIMLLTGWGVAWMLKTDFPVDYFSWYPAIPTFFYMLGITFILLLTGNKKRSERELVNLYLMLKVAKIMVIALAVVFYLLVVKENPRDFGIICAVFYLLYMGFETYFFYQVEKYFKMTKSNE